MATDSGTTIALGTVFESLLGFTIEVACPGHTTAMARAFGASFATPRAVLLGFGLILGFIGGAFGASASPPPPPPSNGYAGFQEQVTGC